MCYNTHKGKFRKGGIRMKRLICIILCLCLATAAGGCAQEPVVPETTAFTPTEEVTVPPPVDPYIPEPIHGIALPTLSETTQAEDGTLLFTKTYQKFQLILNDRDINDIISADLQSRLSVAMYDATDIETTARTAYDPQKAWNPYLMEVSYTPTRIDRAVLSLFGNHLTYRGSVHPSLVTESINYDLSTGSSLTLGDILADGTNGAAVCELIIQALAPRAEKDLYGDHQEVLRDRFHQNYKGLTDWYFSRTGLCFHFSPYDIAPYSSGTIVAEIPYEKLAGVIQDKYLPSSRVVPTGSMYAETYMEDDGERFMFIANVELDPKGTKILLHPDAPITDVRIESGNWSSDGTLYVPSSTIFAADYIDLGNAIVLTAGFSETDPVLRLVYRSGDLEVSAIIDYDAAGDSIQLTHG